MLFYRNRNLKEIKLTVMVSNTVFALWVISD